MKVAVTGASGFIGRYVVTALLKEGQEVIAVTRDAARLAGSAKSVNIVEMDIAHPASDCFDRLGRLDVLIHLAWDGLPNYKSPHHVGIELPRQFSFLKAMVEMGLPSLLVTGTCFEYGMQSGPLSEDLVTQPDNPYGRAKDVLHQQLISLQAVQPFNLTWARLFYMYGEGQPKNSLYSQLKEAVLHGQKVFNMSGGEQLRDYLPVADVANIIVSLALKGKDVGGTVNICSGKPISVRNLIEQWLRENNWKIDLNPGHYPYPDYEPMAFWGDRRRLDSILENQ